ncbi:MAG: hypothetical protein LBB81_00885 [Treponema sp.]|jgi:hypothetical protein|nr:hypothetical protein [Treponema sp.]
MGIWEKIKEISLKIFNNAKLLFNKFLPERKQRIIASGIAGGIIILLVFVISITRDPVAAPLSEKKITVTPNLIPPEDFFLPEEPDYLPGVLLGRERRKSWTEEDAMDYWQNPMISGEDEWRNNIETAIDKLMERIP